MNGTAVKKSFPTGNLWRASSSLTIEAGPLQDDLDVDFVIIGGGFTGAAAALEAARQGARVALLESETFGHGGSGRNVGLVNAGLWLPPDDVRKEMGEQAGERLIETLGKAPELVWSLIEREGIDCEATHNGTLHLAHSPAGLRDLHSRHAQGIARNFPLTLLDAEETRRRTGSDLFLGALLDARAGTIQPLSYARGLAKAAIADGARLFEHSKVTMVRREQDLWCVTANNKTVRAKALLLATNAYFEGIDIPFRPQFVAMSYCQFATAPMPERLRAEILPGGEGCWDTALVMSSFRIDQAGRMILGAVGNVEGPGRSIHAGWARRKLAQVYPQLADLPFEYAWRGRIAMTSDHIPKIIEFGPSAYAAFGYSGRGIGPGTVFGTAVANAALDGSTADLPVVPVSTHDERFVSFREAYYESGAILTHAIKPRTGFNRRKVSS